MAVPPWATETVLSPWLAADEARVSHALSHVVWWKKKKINKNISLTLYSLRVDVGCVWEVSWRRGQTATYGPQVLLTIAALLSHSGWAAQPWVTEGPKPSVCRWLSIRHLVPNWLQLQLTQAACVLVIFLFDSHLVPLFFRVSDTGASLDWRLGRGSVCYNWFKSFIIEWTLQVDVIINYRWSSLSLWWWCFGTETKLDTWVIIWWKVYCRYSCFLFVLFRLHGVDLEELYLVEKYYIVQIDRFE